MTLGIRELVHCRVNHLLELLLPITIEFLQLLISLDTVILQGSYEVLTSLGVFLGLQSAGFDRLITVFFRLFSASVVGGGSHGAEDRRCRQDSIKVLELVSRPLLVSIGN